MKSIYEISRRLRETLKASGRTQQEIRLSAGLSRQTMNNVLKGTEDYKLSTLLAVAERLGLELVILPKSAARGLGRTPTKMRALRPLWTAPSKAA
jgi:transcriptional regulator with XRE-family HTH domain